jgi:hypothetical protein
MQDEFVGGDDGGFAVGICVPAIEVVPVSGLGWRHAVTRASG